MWVGMSSSVGEGDVMAVRLRVAAEAEVSAERLFEVMTDWPRHRSGWC